MEGEGKGEGRGMSAIFICTRYCADRYGHLAGGMFHFSRLIHDEIADVAVQLVLCVIDNKGVLNVGVCLLNCLQLSIVKGCKESESRSWFPGSRTSDSFGVADSHQIIHITLWLCQSGLFCG